MVSEKKNVLMFVGKGYPPGMSGSSTVIYNLFNGIDSTQIDVIAGYPQIKDDRKLAFKEKRIQESWFLKSTLPFLWRLYIIENIFRYIYYGLKITRSNNINRILLIFPGTSSFIGGYFVARIRNIEYQTYFFDLLSDSRRYILEYILLKLFEKKILRTSHKVYSLSDGLSKYYSKIVDREYILLPHTYIPMRNNEVTILNKNIEKKSILFAGQIHGISLDALQNLVKAVRKINQFEITVKILTNQSKEFLRNNGLMDDFVFCQFISDYDDFKTSQSEADILFSPVAFMPPYPKQAETCFPTKTLDYVNAGRPILVNAPENYFYTKYMTKYKCALVVSSFEPDELKKGIIRLLTDNKLQNKLIKNAKIMAEKNHNKTTIQKRLVENLFY